MSIELRFCTGLFNTDFSIIRKDRVETNFVSVVNKVSITQILYGVEYFDWPKLTARLKSVMCTVQGFESPEICLVQVPFFSVSPKNALVLVPYLSALALSTKALILVPISTKISALVLFSALPIFCQK